MTNLVQSWRPKRFQNRPQNVKKSMLKNKVFSASNFGGIGPRFGRVFIRFFRSKMHANSETKKSVRQAKNTVKTNTKLMSALVQRSIFRTQIHEKSHVFQDIGFGKFFLRILEGFWEAESLDFRVFFDFFGCDEIERGPVALRGAKMRPKRRATGFEPPTAPRVKATGKGREGVNPSQGLG